MAIAIRGTTPATATDSGVSATVAVTLTGAQQPQAGDVLLIIHCNDFYAATNMPTPTVGGSTTGVNAVTNGTADAGTNSAHAKAYTWVAGSTGDQTVSVTETGAHDEEKGIAVFVLSGVDTTTPVDVAGFTVDAVGSSSWVLTAISPTSSTAFLVAHANTGGGGSAGGSVTVPGSMTSQYNTVNGGLMMAGATQQLAASGSTGTRTFTPAGSGQFSGLLIALNTATAGAAPSVAAATPPLPPHLLFQLVAGNQAMWQQGQAGTPITSDTGDASAGFAASATAVKVAAVAGRCAAGVAATSVAKKVAPVTGNAPAGAAAISTAKKVALPSAAAAVGGAAQAIVSSQLTQLPPLPLLFTRAAGDRAVQAYRGQSPFSYIDFGVPQLLTGTSETGTATAGAAAQGTAKKVASVTGTCAAGTAAAGTAKKVSAGSAGSRAGVAAAATVAKRAQQSGAAQAGAVGRATVGSVVSRPQTGTCSAGAAAAGTAKKAAATSGTASAGGAAAGTARKRAQPSASSLAGLACAGTAAKRTAQTGRSCVGVAASRVDTIHQVTGRCAVGLTPRGRARSRTPRPNTGTTVRPNTGITYRPFTGTTYQP